MKVMKFGGTCLGDEDALRRVTRVVKAEKGEKVVTVSAASGVTDSLKDFASRPREEREIDDFLLKLKLRHVDMLPKRDGSVRKEALELIEKKITKQARGSRRRSWRRGCHTRGSTRPRWRRTRSGWSRTTNT
jgi:aspartokinase/homoserine dehydrogenase 1